MAKVFCDCDARLPGTCRRSLLVRVSKNWLFSTMQRKPPLDVLPVLTAPWPSLLGVCSKITEVERAVVEGKSRDENVAHACLVDVLHTRHIKLL
jgi:hypothetical protein